MNEDPAYTWFKLFSLNGLGNIRLLKLYARARNAGFTIDVLFQLPKKDIGRIFTPKGEEIYTTLHQLDEEKVRDEFSRFQENGIEIIHPDHELYPSHMLQLYLDKAPALLFALGNVELLRSDSVAIVGSRDADSRILDISKKTAAVAVKQGWNVISGYARGTDTAAHQGALASGGTTTMVLSFGLEKFSLRSQLKNLIRNDNCLVVSQFHPQAKWENHHAIMRNQLIIGLSRAVIVIHAEEKSGTLNTGYTALKAAIPLLALSPDNFSIKPLGNIELIENGAIEVRDLDRIDLQLIRIRNEPRKFGGDNSQIQHRLPL